MIRHFVAAALASVAFASSPAAHGASAADVATSAKPKPRRRGETRNPIQHVHFSSFIIQ